MARKTKAKDFETVLGELEALVTQLEGADLSLEDALTAYAQGVELARTGAGMLEGAERRVEELKESLAEGSP